MAVLIDVVEGSPPWKKWLWRHGGYLVGPLDQVPARLRTIGVRAAWEAYRFEISRPWVRHLVSDVYLRRPELHERYLSVFPEGQVLDIGLAALVWRRP